MPVVACSREIPGVHHDALLLRDVLRDLELRGLQRRALRLVSGAEQMVGTVQAMIALDESGDGLPTSAELSSIMLFLLDRPSGFYHGVRRHRGAGSCAVVAEDPRAGL